MPLPLPLAILLQNKLSLLLLRAARRLFPALAVERVLIFRARLYIAIDTDKPVGQPAATAVAK